MNLILQGRGPPAIHHLVSANYFLALHKDPTNPSKLRPIGIGTALRRVSATAALYLTAPHLSNFLPLLGQFGIQTSGGIDLAIQSTICQLQQYITSPQTPTRALLLLDLTNMFNAVSRQACRLILQQRPATIPLIPLFDLLHSQLSTSWYYDKSRLPQSFLQEEGFPQGCPLSPLFACLVLSAITDSINTDLQIRATNRCNNNQPMDDDHGATAHTTSILDDTSICLCFQDLPWFLTQLQTRGAPFGIHISLSKIKIMTSTSGRSPLQDLQPPDAHALSTALAFLNPQNPSAAEITTGIRFLGHPIGHPNFVHSFIMQRLTTAASHLERVMLLPNAQTRSIMYRFSIATNISHLLWADILMSATNQLDAYWSSSITHALDTLHTTFLQRSTQQHQPLPPHALLIATLPKRHGGLGIPSAHTMALPSLISTITRSLTLANPPNTPTTLTPYHSNLFRDWHASHLPFFHTFLHALAAFHITTSSTDPVSQLLQHLPNNIQNNLTDQTIQQSHLPRLIATFPSHLLPSLPSTLSPFISRALHQPRHFHPFHIPDHLYTIILNRKLRLPLLPNTHHCQCKQPNAPDPYGDHLFSCRKAPKTHASNTIRDGLFQILRQLAPYSRHTRSTDDVHIEPLGLLPAHSSNIRPADVGIQLIPTENQHHLTYIAIDVTIPPLDPPSPSTTDLPDLSQIATLASRAHHVAARHKFTRDAHTASLLNQHHMALVPFTVDHLGGLGHFAHNLLFHNPSSSQHFLFGPNVPPQWPDDRLGLSSPRTTPKPDAFELYPTFAHCPKHLTSPSPPFKPLSSCTSTPSAPHEHLSLSTFSHIALGHAIAIGLATHISHQLAIYDSASLQKRQLRLRNSFLAEFLPPTLLPHTRPIGCPKPLVQPPHHS